jgi:ribonuclease BN (tRNA processing enzyme)
MNLQISIHSSPRFATWIWIPDWRLLIDAGDGATQQLGYKIRKIDTVALTHSHRDHIGGLLQVVNQRGEAGSFAVAHPCGSKSFGQLEAFANKFNPGTSWRAVWHALEEGDELPGGVEDRVLKAFRTRHYHFDDVVNAPRSWDIT